MRAELRALDALSPTPQPTESPFLVIGEKMLIFTKEHATLFLIIAIVGILILCCPFIVIAVWCLYHDYGPAPPPYNSKKRAVPPKAGIKAPLLASSAEPDLAQVGEGGTMKMGGLNNVEMQLRKVCNHPYLHFGEDQYEEARRNTPDHIWRSSGKFELLQRILPKLFKLNHRVLIFSQMVKMLDMLLLEHDSLLVFVAYLDVECIHEACKGYGTKDTPLIRAFATRNKRALARVNIGYREAYGEQVSDIQSKMAGEDIIRDADLVGLVTTSFYSVGSAQYNRVSLPEALGGARWERIGISEGQGTMHFSRETTTYPA